MKTVVLYAKADMEPITIFKVPFTDAQIKLLGGSFRVVPRAPIKFDAISVSDIIKRLELPVVFVETLDFVYNGQLKKLFVTDNEEAALMLRSELLPGQRGQRQREIKEAYAEGFVAALSGRW